MLISICSIAGFSVASNGLIRQLPISFTISIRHGYGYDALWTNYGKIRNKGIEFNLGWRDHVDDVSYSVSANISTVRNKVLRLGDADFYDSSYSRTEVGRSIGDFYLIQTDGIFQSKDEVYAHTTTLEDGTVKIVQATAQPVTCAMSMWIGNGIPLTMSRPCLLRPRFRMFAAG